MRKTGFLTAIGAIVALLGACTGAAQAIPASPTYHGGPVFSEYRTQEVVWSHEAKTAASTITEGLAAFLGDVAAASGTTEDVFAMLPQYSTQGLSGGSQIAAYRSSYLGGAVVAPTSSAALTTTQLAADLNQEITAGALPAPGLDAGGAANTVYVVVLPASMEACEGSECSGPSNNKSIFCSLRGIAHYNSTPYAFVLMPDLTGALSSGCGGTAPTQLEKETSTLTQQLGETITDAFNVESKEAWMNNESLGVGYICNQQNTTNTINGHTWTVQKLWSNINNACVGGNEYFHPPSTDFSAIPTANSAVFSAHGSSTNKLGSIAAGIASYSWDFGDGQSGTGATPSHSYATAGTYTVTVTATDTLGFTAHATHEVTVSPPPTTTTGGGAGSGGSGGGGAANSAPAPGGGGTPVALSLSAISSSGAATTSATGAVTSGQTISCPAGGGLCVVSLKGEIEAAPAKHKGKKRKITVASTTITISPGSAIKVAFKLNGAGKTQLLASGHLLVKLTLTLRQGSETPVVSSHTINLKAPKRHGHKH